MGKLLIGWAEESLVPEKKVRLAGQFFERISEYVETEISVTQRLAFEYLTQTSLYSSI